MRSFQKCRDRSKAPISNNKRIERSPQTETMKVAVRGDFFLKRYRIGRLMQEQKKLRRFFQALFQEGNEAAF